MKKVLLLTNKDDVTVDFIVRELKSRDIPYYRLNTEELLETIEVNFDFVKQAFILFDKNKNITVDLNEFGAVYYRRPELPNLRQINNITIDEKKFLQTEVTYLLEGIYKILSDRFWLNNVYDIREAENKIYQLQLARGLGFLMPDSIITNQYEKVQQFYIEHDKNCIIKPIKSGNLKSESAPKVVFTNSIKSEQLESRDRIESFPLYMQNKIEKRYDLRVTVVGNTLYTAEIHSQENGDSSVDWRRGSTILEHKIHTLPSNIEEKCISLTKQLNLNFSAIDLVLDRNGSYVFLEINPNGQWAWIENRLGFPISRDIVSLLERAL